MPKVRNLFGATKTAPVGNSKKEPINKGFVKRKKEISETQSKRQPKQTTKRKTVIPADKPNKSTNSPTEKITTGVDKKWYKTTDKTPEELRPIEFNTKCKKPVYGYKLRTGYITNTPYYIDLFKKEHGYIEWRYISYCTTLLKCPNEFPLCPNCKNFKGGSK